VVGSNPRKRVAHDEHPLPLEVLRHEDVVEPHQRLHRAERRQRPVIAAQRLHIA
jgi:hypothetical protein